MSDSDSKALTKYPEGSIRELFSISLPLMISTLATLFMIFVDRMFLARYSLDTLNAAVNAGTWAWAFFGGMGMLTAMSEVFVSQHNGAKNPDKIGVFVWQMIWVSLFSFIFFIPMGLFGGPILYAGSPYETLQIEYFELLMVFGPFYALQTALAGFYIGRGKTKILIVLALFGNLINIILDRILIFGIDGLIPEMGIQGAAIATCFGYTFETVVLFILFLRKKNREKYNTGSWKFHGPSFRKSFRIGFPQGIFYMLEVIGFAIFYQMMTSMSLLHITVSGICQSILILLSFFLDGLNRGVAALSGNFIGAKRFDMVKEVLRSALYLQLFFSLFIIGFFLIDPKWTISYILPGEFEKLSAYDTLWFCLACSFIYTTLDGVRWIITGILTAAGDTLFLLVSGVISVWGLLILPVYAIVVKYHLSVEIAWAICALYTLLSCLIYGFRYFRGKWKEIDLIHSEEKPETIS